MAISAGDVVVKINGDSSGLNRSLDQVDGKIKKSTGQWQQRMKKVGMVMVGATVAIGGASLKMAIDFETAFAGVRKTVDATEEEFSELDTALREMTKRLPQTYVELAGIAEAAGQLGIAKDDIMSFTETIAKLGMATNLTGEEAATSLARFMNITGMATDDIEKLGSVIVDLGNNSATTEAEIVDMAMRLAGAGTAIGMSETQIMAFSAALSSMGLRSEAGGTAFSKTMLEMNSAVAGGGKELEAFAFTAGMTTAEFSKLFKEDATGAIMLFINGLSEMKSSGQDITPVLDEVGLSGIRVVDALLRATGAQELLTDAQTLAEKAWEENIALNEESAKRLDTTASKMAILKNEMALTAATLGQALIPILTKLMAAVTPIITKIGEWIEKHPKLSAGILITVGAIGGLMVVAGPLMNMFSLMAKTIPIITAAMHSNTIAIVAHKIATVASSIATKIATAVQWLWNVALSANPIGLIILAIAGLILLIVYLTGHWDELKEKFWDAFHFMQEKVEAFVGFFTGIPEKIRAAFTRVKDFILAPFRAAAGVFENMINFFIKTLNKLSVKIPNWVPGMGGKTIGFNIPEVSLAKFAKGGMINEPTLLYGLKSQKPYAIAGEAGPERVSPSGSGGDTNINISQMVVREDADIYRVARELFRMQQSQGRQVGVG